MCILRPSSVVFLDYIFWFHQHLLKLKLRFWFYSFLCITFKQIFTAFIINSLSSFICFKIPNLMTHNEKVFFDPGNKSKWYICRFYTYLMINWQLFQIKIKSITEKSKLQILQWINARYIILNQRCAEHNTIQKIKQILLRVITLLN